MFSKAERIAQPAIALRAHRDDITEAVRDATSSDEAEDDERPGAEPGDELVVERRPVDVAEVLPDNDHGPRRQGRR